jgi:hypothetical protein
MAVLPAVTAVLSHHRAMNRWTDSSVVSTGYRGNGFLSAVTAVLLHHSVMKTRNDCSVVSRVQRENGGISFSYCSTVKSQSYEYTD